MDGWPPLAHGARLIGPTQLRYELPLSHHGATALAARSAVEVLARLADGEPLGNLLVGGAGHPGGQVLGGRGGEVGGFLGERWRGVNPRRVQPVLDAPAAHAVGHKTAKTTQPADVSLTRRRYLAMIALNLWCH